MLLEQNLFNHLQCFESGIDSNRVKSILNIFRNLLSYFFLLRNVGRLRSVLRRWRNLLFEVSTTNTWALFWAVVRVGMGELEFSVEGWNIFFWIAWQAHPATSLLLFTNFRLKMKMKENILQTANLRAHHHERASPLQKRAPPPGQVN